MKCHTPSVKRDASASDRLGAVTELSWKETIDAPLTSENRDPRTLITPSQRQASRPIDPSVVATGEAAWLSSAATPIPNNIPKWRHVTDSTKPRIRYSEIKDI